MLRGSDGLRYGGSLGGEVAVEMAWICERDAARFLRPVVPSNLSLET